MINFLPKERVDWGRHILRLGLSAVFLYFGFSQIFNSLSWVSLVPMWASNLLHLPPAMLVLGNGLMEIVLGTLLATGFYVRIISVFLGLHLIPIALGFGLEPTAVRDLGLSVSAFVLALIY